MDALFSKWLTPTLTPSREVQKSGKKIIYGKQQSTTKNPWKRDTKFSILYCYPVKVQRASHSIPPRVWVRVCGLAYHVLDQLTGTTCGCVCVAWLISFFLFGDYASHVSTGIPTHRTNG